MCVILQRISDHYSAFLNRNLICNWYTYPENGVLPTNFAEEPNKLVCSTPKHLPIFYPCLRCNVQPTANSMHWSGVLRSLFECIGKTKSPTETVRAPSPIPFLSWRKALRVCLVKGYRSEKAGNRGHFFANSRSIVNYWPRICGKYGPIPPLLQSISL